MVFSREHSDLDEFDDDEAPQSSWTPLSSFRFPTRLAGRSAAETSQDTVDICSLLKIPSPPIYFRCDGQRKKLDAHQRSQIRFIISHMRNDYLDSADAIFNRDGATLNRVMENTYDNITDDLADDQQWFNNKTLLRDFEAILDPAKIKASEAIIQSARDPARRNFQVPSHHASPSKVKLRSKRLRDQDEGEKKGNGVRNPETENANSIGSKSQVSGVPQTQSRDDRANKRVKIEAGENVEEESDDDMVARRARRKGKMKEARTEETDVKREKGSIFRHPSTATLDSTPPSPPPQPPTPSQKKRARNATPSSSRDRLPSSPLKSCGSPIATPPSLVSAIARELPYEEAWLRELLRRHNFESESLVRYLREASVHPTHFNFFCNNEDFTSVKVIEKWLAYVFRFNPLPPIDLHILAEIIWKAKTA